MLPLRLVISGISAPLLALRLVTHPPESRRRAGMLKPVHGLLFVFLHGAFFLYLRFRFPHKE